MEVEVLGLFKDSKVVEETINNKDINDETLLNKEEYHPSTDTEMETKKKGSIWTKEITFKRKPKARKVESPDKPKSVRVVGIDIGTSFIKIVEGRVKGEKIHIYKMDKLPTPKNILNDGIVEEIDITSMAIKSFLKNHKIKNKNLAFVSSSSTIISRELVVPYVDKLEELRNLVEYEIQQFLFINLNNYEVQFMKSADVVDNGIDKQKIFAIIYPKNIIEVYRNLTEKMELNPYALDLTNNAIRKVANLAKFFNSDLLEKKSTNMFIDFGSNTINISIINQGRLDFIRTLPFGGQEIDNFIANSEAISLEDAEKLKIEKIDISTKEENNSLTDGVVRIVDDWINDINRIIQFYANKGSGKYINHIYLYGGASKLKGLDDYIEKRLRIPTANIFTVDNLEFDKGLAVSTVEEYINAIGALIRL